MSEADVDGVPPDEGAPPPVPAAPGPGAQLRAERERQGLAVSDVAQRLKYAPRQIEAIEADDYAALPGLTFVRGFVRGYAKLLGVDAAPLVAALERDAGQDGGPTTVQLQSVSPVRAQFPARGVRHASAWPWIIAIVLAVVGIGGYSVYQWEVPGSLITPAPPGAQAPQAGPAVAAPAGTVAGSIQSDVSQTTDGGQSPALPPLLPPAPAGERAPGEGSGAVAFPPQGDSSPATPASGSISVVTTPSSTGAAVTQGRIRLVFRGESWTEIKEAGGRVVYSRKGMPGTEQWADGQPPFDLVVGNAPETRLFYRGNEVDLAPYIKGTVARLQLQ
jgi:cytoskeleton protein RodZ